jgi:two-component system, chemotaxis family, chemotaxis protein CheY
MYRVECSRLRFLIVDDNNHMRRILRALLHGFGVREAYEAEDGASGLEAFQSYSRMIRDEGVSANPYTPVIMISGHAEKRRVFEARDAGVNEFLVKPISAKGLYQRIASVVMHPRPFIRTGSYFGPCRRRTGVTQFSGPDRRKGGAMERIEQQPLTQLRP